MADGMQGEGRYRRDGQYRIGTADIAGAVRDNDRVSAGIVTLGMGACARAGGLTGKVGAVETPLVSQERGAATTDAEGGGVAHRNALIGRLRVDSRGESRGRRSDFEPRAADAQLVPLHRGWKAGGGVLAEVKAVNGVGAGGTVGAAAGSDVAARGRLGFTEGGRSRVEPQRDHVGRYREIIASDQQNSVAGMILGRTVGVGHSRSALADADEIAGGGIALHHHLQAKTGVVGGGEQAHRGRETVPAAGAVAGIVHTRSEENTSQLQST